jgi:hypothetical protein
MPVDRSVGEDLARTLADLYAGAERQLVAAIARHLAAGKDAPDWATRKLLALRTLQDQTASLLARLAADTTGQVEQALLLAYVRGGRQALDELARQHPTLLQRFAAGTGIDALQRLADLLTRRRRTSVQEAIAEVRQALPGIDAIGRLAFTLAAQVQGTHLRILRWTLDTYRSVVATASTAVLTGTRTRLQVAQGALDRLVSQGITGFVDRAGRNWQLASYVEMAVRTTTAQAAVQGHLDRLGDLDLDLVFVSDAPQECPLCRPWEGKVLARHTLAGARDVQAANPVTGHPTTVHVAGSVAEAVAAGLMHPNCRHSLSAYLPGTTKIPTGTEDPEGDLARQRQRQIERHIRGWKLRAAAAMTDEAKTLAAAKVRAWQTALREHLAAHPELRRLRHREQVGTAR